jgi:hypothetical protein
VVKLLWLAVAEELKAAFYPGLALGLAESPNNAIVFPLEGWNWETSIFYDVEMISI